MVLVDIGSRTIFHLLLFAKGDDSFKRVAAFCYPFLQKGVIIIYRQQLTIIDEILSMNFSESLYPLYLKSGYGLSEDQKSFLQHFSMLLNLRFLNAISTPENCYTSRSLNVITNEAAVLSYFRIILGPPRTVSAFRNKLLSMKHQFWKKNDTGIEYPRVCAEEIANDLLTMPGFYESSYLSATFIVLPVKSSDLPPNGLIRKVGSFTGRKQLYFILSQEDLPIIKKSLLGTLPQ